MFGFRKKVLGLDIGSRCVKGILLSKGRGQVALEKYFYLDLPEALNGAPSPELVRQLVADLVAGAGLQKYLVASAIEDREMQVVTLSLPAMPENDLRSAVVSEIETQLGTDSKELSIDYSILPSSDERSSLQVLAYYTKREAVTSHLGVLENAGLKPYSVECAMHAALEAARFNDYIQGDETCLLVDSGDTHTSIGLVSKGELLQFSSIPSGSGAINQQLMDQFSCSFQNSELRKLNHRLEKAEGAEDPEGRSIEQGYYELIVSIHDTATYFRASRKAQSIQKVVIMGGGLMKDGVAGLLEQSLNVPVILADPLRKIEIFGGKEGDRERLPQISPMMHVAVGLALRGVA